MAFYQVKFVDHSLTAWTIIVTTLISHIYCCFVYFYKPQYELNNSGSIQVTELSIFFFFIQLFLLQMMQSMYVIHLQYVRNYYGISILLLTHMLSKYGIQLIFINNVFQFEAFTASVNVIRTSACHAVRPCKRFSHAFYGHLQFQCRRLQTH